MSFTDWRPMTPIGIYGRLANESYVKAAFNTVPAVQLARFKATDNSLDDIRLTALAVERRRSFGLTTVGEIPVIAEGVTSTRSPVSLFVADDPASQLDSQ